MAAQKKGPVGQASGLRWKKWHHRKEATSLMEQDMERKECMIWDKSHGLWKSPTSMWLISLQVSFTRQMWGVGRCGQQAQCWLTDMLLRGAMDGLLSSNPFLLSYFTFLQKGVVGRKIAMQKLTLENLLKRDHQG